MVAKLNFFGNKKPSLVVLAMGLVSALAACATNSASRVAGYPNLREVPTLPEGVVTPAEWRTELSQLKQTNQELLSQSTSRPLTPSEADVSWANQTRDALVADPKSAPAPATDDALAWAEQTRARLEAELKTTPH
ncbi:MAG: hypothetical protein AAB680_03385 [Pseudomonadota bacterium]